MKKSNIIFFSSLVLVYLVATLTISNINGSYAASNNDLIINEAYRCPNYTGGSLEIIYNTNGGNKLESTKYCGGCNPENQPKTLSTPTKSGYIFDGWYYDEALTKKVEGTNPSDVKSSGYYDSNGCYISNNKVTLYAKWTKLEHIIDCSSFLITGGSIEIIYNTNGGNKLESTKYCGGCNPISQPKTLSTPTKPGYIFEGWYYDEALTEKVEGTSPNGIRSSGHYDSNGCYIPDGKVTLYAKWTKIEYNIECPNYTGGSFELIYETNGGNKLENTKVCRGCAVYSDLPTPTKSGYIFDGWYYDSALTKKVETKNTSDIKVSKKYDKNNCHIGYKNVTLYPKWIEKNVCKEEKTLTISFDTLGGSNIEDIKITSKEFTVFKIDPEIPTKENYTFVGWYYDSGLTNKVDTTALTLNNNNTNCEDVQITLYAKYTSVDTAVLKGKIVDSNKAALAYTKVSIDDELETLTDDNGYYELENVSDGNHELIIKDINDNIISKTTISILNQTSEPENDYTLTYTKDKNMISANIRIDKSGNIEFIKTDTKSTNSLIIIVGLIIVVIMAVIINQNNNAKPKDDEELDAE